MLEQIDFAAGATPGAQNLSLRPAVVNILVGPNNSGKSLALREIEFLLSNPPGSPNLSRRVVSGMRWAPLVSEAAELQRIFREAAHVEDEYTFHCSRLMGSMAVQKISKETITSFSDREISSWGHVLGSILVARLDGPSRLGLVSEKPYQDLLAAPENHLVALFQDTERRKRLRSLVYEAFGMHLVLDPTKAGTLRIRMAKRPPSSDVEEQALDAAARTFHSAAQSIGEFSDGVKGYVGLLAAVLSLRSKVFLIDEPEAFLHPPLARRLGFHLSRLAAERSAQVFAGTHSSEFLMGCVESGVDIQVVRLTYAGAKATARYLSAQDLRELLQDPLARSADVLSSLFHSGAVVTESDADRAFYQEINHRLTHHTLPAPDKPSIGNDYLFLNAQNKQTVHRIIGPLRRLGVAVAGIVDIDVLKEGGTVWANLLTSANIPEVTRKGLESTRAALSARFKASGVDMKKTGISGLSDGDRASCLDLFGQLAKYGVFVVSCGELESWLPELGVTGHGADWTISMFDRLGADPKGDQYVSPGTDDVWAFLRSVSAWLNDPDRRGINS